MSIIIQNPGPVTTVQDLGRFGVMKNGFTQSGAMDQRSAKIANALVGNSEDKALLEMTLMGITAAFDSDCVIAVSGGDMSPSLNGIAIKNNKAYRVKSGDTIKLGIAQNGMRAYLAVSGGIKCDSFLGSCSTDMKSAVGGICGRRLKAGDVVEILPCDTKIADIQNREIEPFVYASLVTVRAVSGPQDDMFTEQDLKVFFNSRYKVTRQADRMGIRLYGIPLKSKSGVDIISDGIVFGSVQVPKNGMPIVLMADHQTTGGYAKIATVISADLPLLAQVKPDDTIMFRRVGVKEAEKAAVDAAKQLEKLLKF